MRTKPLAALIAIITVLVCILPAHSALISNADTVGDARSVVDGIIGYKLSESGSGSVQDWINGALTANAGATSEFYIIALSQSGGSYDFSSYERALRDYLSANSVASATSREKFALAFSASGSTDPYISDVLADSIGGQGVMSWVFGLHLLNNGYTGSYTAQQCIDVLLSQQLDDGGWAVMGAVGDIDVTAMTVQALAPYYRTDSSVTGAVDRAIELLSGKQLDTGDFRSYQFENCESTAQVVLALASLGIDPMTDPRFIKGDNSLLSGLMRYHCSDGSFSHTVSGASDQTATLQVFCALIAYLRQQSGMAPFYSLDRRVLPEAPSVHEVQEPTDTPEPSPTPTSEQPPETVTEPVQTGTTSAVTTSAAASGTAAETAPAVSTAAPALITDPVSLPALTTTLSAESTTETAAQTEIRASGTLHKNGGYKLPVTLIIIGLSGVTALVLLVIGKRHPKNFIALAVVTGAAVAFVQFTNFQSAEEYYAPPSAKENVTGTVTMTIRCDTVVDRADHHYIPESGVILDVTEFEISDGETAYDILTQAARTYGIQLDTKGGGSMVYVAGINYLYEYDFGELSGWMFRVNGDTPSVGSGAFELSDGDFIEWLYSTNIGNDLK